MSGDVQPRKRKDKKKRKDDSADQAPAPPQLPPLISLNDDVNIHVHKEDGTGGNICSKIIFILLSSALIVLIGLIITEYRGLTDLDTVDNDSRYSQYFEGWVDTTADDHDDHDDVEKALSHEEEDHGQHDEEEEEEEKALSHEEDDHNDEDDHDEDEDDEEQAASDEEVDASQEDEDDDEAPQDDDDDEIAQEDDDEEQEDDDNDSQVDDDDEESPLSEEQQQDDDDDNVSQEEPANDDDDDEDEDQKDKSPEVQGDDEDEKAVSDEVQDVENTGGDDDDEAADNEKDDDDDDDEAKTVQMEDEAEDVKMEESDDKEGDEGEAGSNMVVKLGVGLALLVVAHVVLIKKWKSAPEESTRKDEAHEPTPDLSRRNTLIPPPPLQEIEHDIEDDGEEYSDDEEEYSEEEAPVETKSAKLKYQELRTNYTRPFTSGSDEPKPDDEDEEYEEEGSEEEDEVDEEVEEEQSENEEFNEDEDEELLKRLEEKYGKLDAKQKGEDDEELSTWERVNPEVADESDDEEYANKDITNPDDWEVKEKIDEAQKSINNNAANAIKLFDDILQQFPSSPRSLYGKAQALDALADQKRSNELLQKALDLYLEVLNDKKTTNTLFKVVAERAIKRLRFIGQYRKAISVQNALIEKFPDISEYSNELAVTYLTVNRIPEARVILQKVLSKWPNDGFALVHYGFILKTVDDNLVDGIQFLQKGIQTNHKGVIDGRFFFHLGDALTRVGKNDEALKLYEHGVKHGVFLSKYQRSLYNVPRLSGKPWWNKNETPYDQLFKELESNWKEIKREGLNILNQKGYFQDESEKLRDKGDWKQFELYARGQKNVENCKKCPITCGIIDSNPSARGCKRGQTKFSVMHPGTHVWPHCGPTNCRLRAHLGLEVPSNTYIRVAEETRSWENGKVLIFDDSFEHEVWHNGSQFRLVLIVDVWHPELTAQEIKGLSPI
ncbi:unnamed protein product [Brassicogethes aeneus]|uniref:Aspartyl/asparaginy/proline hydroxylase domain-containing protein n=1 Tax=Brassicogethes aeneus TaxID=1431903 RepID=A0A9P0FLV4_BRAAE|nr:unnamed protein product [Brassicogethes aeneus]